MTCSVMTWSKPFVEFNENDLVPSGVSISFFHQEVLLIHAIIAQDGLSLLMWIVYQIL